MTSFRITISPSDRVAGRFVGNVRRSLQKVLAVESKKRPLTQSDLARAIGVDRSVISREIRGHRDITLGRVAQLAWAMGRNAVIDFPQRISPAHQNAPTPTPTPVAAPTPSPAATATANNLASLIPPYRAVVTPVSMAG